MVDRRRTFPSPPSLKRGLAGIFLLVAWHGTVIAAEPPSPEEQANVHLQAGSDKLEAGDFAGAEAEYRAGFDLYPRSNLLFNIGLAQIGQGHLLQAVESFEWVLMRPETTPEVATQARERLDRLHEKLAVVEVNGGDGASLTVDGQPQRPLPLRKPLLVFPGVHKLRATRDGYLPFERQISTAAGTRADVAVMLEPVPAPPKPKRRYWLWGTLGAAVVAGAVIGFVATRRHEGSAPPCPMDVVNQCIDR
jgi:hypothetical protein